ncbi:MAG TPA: peptidoglycan bridge formation glycyltransferase FemA/FemB family protein, partial [Actinomycetes bacterium]|nr:peptidoglycan bridge formation glycyltransferase FemA/FemB family protein [Actinomycetes bacterium]
MPSPLTVRSVTSDEHRAFVTSASGSFLQTPAWGAVKADWANVGLGWFDGSTLVGTALVLLRQTPKVKRYLAYVPEGPVIDWKRFDVTDITTPLLAELRRRKAFSVKLGPQVVARRWTAATLKAAISDGSAGRIGDVPPDYLDEAAAALTHGLS